MFVGVATHTELDAEVAVDESVDDTVEESVDEIVDAADVAEDVELELETEEIVVAIDELDLDDAAEVANDVDLELETDETGPLHLNMQERISRVFNHDHLRPTFPSFEEDEIDSDV